MKPSPLLNLPTLAALLTRVNIKLVDIGGRDKAMPRLIPLAPFADYYTCEPDMEEAERLRIRLPQACPWRTVTVMTEAIAAREGRTDLHLTQQPGMSSLLEPDPAVAGRYCLASKFQVASVTTVPAITLDDAAARYGFQEACFLKADTQGTELDILRSGRTLLTTSLLGVYVETNFHPFYREQSLFADVDTYLRRHDFSLFGLYRTMLRRASYRASLYSRRVVVWAHCLYFREPETLLATDTPAAALRVARLLGLALAFQHYDLAFEIVETGRHAKLFPEDEWSRVTEEVESFVSFQTRRLVRKAEVAGTAAALMARAIRDDRHRE
jgi:FkbM family methyltransferase